MGKTVTITNFSDSNLMMDLTTGRSQTGIIHLLKKTPIEWFSKSKSCVETDTYGSEYAADRIFTDHIANLINTIRYHDFPLYLVNGSDASFMFGGGGNLGCQSACHAFW